MKKIKILSMVAFAALAFSSCQKDDDVLFNNPPKVEAGPDQVHEEAIKSFELSGSATDNDGKVLAYQWVQVGGPNKAIVKFPGSAKATVVRLAVGTYKFQLLATDEDGATGVDSVNVTVKKIERDPVAVTLQTLSTGDIQLLKYPGWNSNPGAMDIPLVAWTDGAELTVRNVLKFDMSNIPADAIITSAKLYLYSYPGNPINGNKVDANFGTNNAFLVQRINADWDPATIGWNNKPTLTTVDQVLVPHTTLSKLDVVVDVKTLLQSMVGGTNYGFHLQLQDEVMYTSRIFVSSHNTTYPNLAPKLVVEYK